jgi:hypothetical protein
MSNYFSKMPNISYSGIQVKDITRRSAFISSVLANPYAYLPYTVKEGEKPEDIAYYYYGSVDYTWLVLLANNIVDSYYDWPLDDRDFNEYIIKKYESISGKKGYDVVAWAQNENINDNILYYYREVDQGEPAEGSFTIVSDLDTLDVTQDQVQELFDNEIVTIDGVQYRLVRQ